MVAEGCTEAASLEIGIMAASQIPPAAGDDLHWPDAVPMA
jgi:hypothetical protein